MHSLRLRPKHGAMLRGATLVTAMLAAAPAAAQDTEIVITGRGLDAAPGERVYDSVTIGRERLTGSASNRLEDVLRDVAGFQNFRRSDARSANPTSQGATLRALGGNASSRVLLVLDGVPQTDPFGGWIFWPAYDPRRLADARVVRGGGSGAYGPGALAGTIELTSAGPSELSGAVGELAYGSRDSLDAFAGLGVKIGEGYASLSGSLARGDGFVPVIERQRGPVDRRAPYRQGSVSARGIVPLGRQTELQANGLWFKDARQRGTRFTGIDTRGLDGSLRLVGRGRWRWSALVYLQKRDFYNSFASVAAGRTSVSRSALQYDVPSSGTGARIELRPPVGNGLDLRVGGDWRRTEGETNELFNFQAGVGTRRRRAGGENQTLGGFAELSWTSGPLTLTGGGRIDRWWIEDGFLLEKMIATNAILTDAHFPNRSGWRPTARAGIAVDAADGLTLRSATYLGWRLPTINELYRPFRVGPDATAANAALKPERLKGAEAGIDYRPTDAVRLGVTIFVNRLEQGIANVTLGAGPGIFPGVGFVAAGGTYSQRRNIDAIRARGIELNGDVTFGGFHLSASYSHVDAEVRASGAAAALDGRRPAQTPRDSLSATIAWHSQGGAQASLTTRYVGAQYEDDLESDRLKSALTFDATVAIPVAKRLSIEARAENLTNKRVAAGISGTGIIERATPRTLWIGLRLR